MPAQKRIRPRTAKRRRTKLSTSMEDYLETIFQLDRVKKEVRISDIANRLKVRLPPVTRAVQALSKLGLVRHEERLEVELSPEGRRLAEALAHRHSDLLYLLTEVLGVPADAAEADTCQMEHGISPQTAQRLHEFLEHYSALGAGIRDRLRARRKNSEFRFLPAGKQTGWRA